MENLKWWASTEEQEQEQKEEDNSLKGSREGGKVVNMS